VGAVFPVDDEVRTSFGPPSDYTQVPGNAGAVLEEAALTKVLLASFLPAPVHGSYFLKEFGR
jgi:hypothetical protein